MGLLVLEVCWYASWGRLIYNFPVVGVFVISPRVQLLQSGRLFLSEWLVLSGPGGLLSVLIDAVAVLGKILRLSFLVLSQL